MSVGFDETARKLMDEVLSWDPVFATQVGWHKYDSLLGDPSSEAMAKRAERCRELIGDLKRIPTGSMSDDEVLDLDLAIHLLENKAYELGELRLHERGCSASSTIGYSLFFLSSRERPGIEERIEAIIGRIEAIPAYIAKCRRAIRRPYRLWNEADYEVGQELPGLLRSMERFVGERTDDRDKLVRVGRAVAEAVSAVEEHNTHLKKEIIPSADAAFAITPEEYSRYLEVKGYGVTPEQLVEIGEAYLHACRRAITEVARQITPNGSSADAINAMKSDHPADSETVLREYRSAVERSREFTVAKDLCTIPEGERLVVIETPEFMRPIFAFAGQFEPGKFDGDLTGLFLVTPPGDDSAMLREHSHAGIINTAVHEGYPGHHLQGICSIKNPSYIRVLSTSPDFSEGWGLYAEQLMLEQGFNNSTYGRLTVLNDLRYRIVRLLVEAQMVLGTANLETAARMLEAECSVDPNAAMTEARSCAMCPTYFSSYLLGMLSVLQLREEVERAMRSRFSLRFFHDSMLFSGCLPMRFMRRAVSIRLKREHAKELLPNPEPISAYALRKVKAGLI